MASGRQCGMFTMVWSWLSSKRPAANVLGTDYTATLPLVLPDWEAGRGSSPRLPRCWNDLYLHNNERE
ncbi:hypothetical protein RRG08_014788 [Elysia crispata]|uniref:Uncharacterized protein n=1 Tax=Elysia crispata TaxID=231223 RepID=A0AAE1AVI4_9GAST|nr:hypothetical protein RRG08_014788 [Elysia crispata]